ncbi:hypothetical protein FN846DRAFT_947017, partial [Sphaerosporella brunnea]
MELSISTSPINKYQWRRDNSDMPNQLGVFFAGAERSHAPRWLTFHFEFCMQGSSLRSIRVHRRRRRSWPLRAGRYFGARVCTVPVPGGQFDPPAACGDPHVHVCEVRGRRWGSSGGALEPRVRLQLAGIRAAQLHNLDDALSLSVSRIGFPSWVFFFFFFFFFFF